MSFPTSKTKRHFYFEHPPCWGSWGILAHYSSLIWQKQSNQRTLSLERPQGKPGQVTLTRS